MAKDKQNVKKYICQERNNAVKFSCCCRAFSAVSAERFEYYLGGKKRKKKKSKQKYVLIECGC